MDSIFNDYLYKEKENKVSKSKYFILKEGLIQVYF